MSSIRVSPKHGLNPAIPLCFFCQKPKNEIILAGRMKDDQEAPRAMVWDRVPCDECKDWMSKGVVFISVKDGETKTTNPYRTGGWCVLSVEAVERMREVVTGEGLIDHVLEKRVAFIEDEVWDSLGLPARS